MLRITADIFSGRPNPVWEVRDESVAVGVMRFLAAERDLLADEAPATGGLGFRGFRIEVLADDLGVDAGLGAETYLAVGPHARGVNASGVGQRLIDLVRRSDPVGFGAEDALPLDTALSDFLTTQLEEATALGTSTRATAPDRRGEEVAESPEEAAAVTCYIEKTAFNPGFWNNDQTTLRNNNCYNYASNWRTNTFAQPGRGSGAMYRAVTCDEVSRGALGDGMHRRFDCFPDSEKPRPLVAMVVAPGPGFVDYHWYRLHAEGFWGHKPGSTEARNVDNSGTVITNPETANRGPYTLFCGYFYGCNSQRMRIR